MNTRIIVPTFGVILIAGVGALVTMTKKPTIYPQVPAAVATSTAPTTAKSDNKQNPAPTPVSTGAGFSMVEIAKHNSNSSCWSVVSGSVYDLTSWIPNHPGGEGAILGMCGKDGTDLYSGQHGGSRGPARILSGFKLGELSK